MVLQDMTLSVEKGEFLAIVGPSGSGKTTLAHLIGGLMTPSEGAVHFVDEKTVKQNDKNLSLCRNQRVGFVFQNFGLIPHYTVAENIALPLIVAGVSARARKKQIAALLESIGLEARVNARADTLSGGERQRVAIARALVMKPDIIIADEPTGSLDSVRGSEIMAILRKLHAEGVTILMVTHDHNIASQADRTITILDGRIEKEMTNANS